MSVFLILLQEYLSYVETPMDLGTIEQSLQAGDYDNMAEVFDDIRLIFSNSKKFNQVKRSKIYSMTMNLGNYMETKMKELSAREKRCSQQSELSTRSTRNSVR